MPSLHSLPFFTKLSSVLKVQQQGLSAQGPS